MTEETRNKIRIANTGKVFTPEHKLKLSLSQKGRRFTPEHKLKLSRAHLGKTPWNKGVPCSPETRQKVSEANKGKPSWNRGRTGGTPWNKGIPMSSATREKLSRARTGQMVGPAHPNWKGGTKSERNRIMEMAIYKQWRKAVFDRDDYRCYSCGQKGFRLEAHHIYPWAYYPRLRFMLENGITLCEECHKAISPRLKGPDNIVAPAGMILRTINA